MNKIVAEVFPKDSKKALLKVIETFCLTQGCVNILKVELLLRISNVTKKMRV